MISLVIITDGRDCVGRTIEAMEARLHGPISQTFIYDDSGDQTNRCALAEFGYPVMFHPEGRQGFGGAIRYVWNYLARECAARYVFWLEDDFIIERDVDLVDMVDVLDMRPHLTQLVLRRQAWNAEERAAGGIVEQHPGDYTDHTDGRNRWLEHRRFWSTNPHLTRLDQIAHGWPDGDHSEGQFTHYLLRDPAARFGFWGARDDDPWVTHIGHERVGNGY